jgi:hypothetical protein
MKNCSNSARSLVPVFGRRPSRFCHALLEKVVVQQCQDGAVFDRADQPAKALLHYDDGSGHLVFKERGCACCVNGATIAVRENAGYLTASRDYFRTVQGICGKFTGNLIVIKYFDNC